MENLSSENNRVLSVKEWALTIFITSIPLVGLVMLFVWAFGDESNINRTNWAKGNLLIILLGIVLAMSFLFMFGGIALLSNLFD